MLTLAGLLLVVAFDAAPGEAPAPPVHWPAGSMLPHADRRPALLVFIHPQCGCSSATFAELAHIGLIHGIAAPDVIVAAFRPGQDSAWRIDSLTAKASVIPGARVVWDDRAVEARRFGATTSGDVLLYSALGTLLFEGGVTASRGHEGDNNGLTRLLEVLQAKAPQTVAAGEPQAAARGGPVFGCSLASPRGKTSAPASLALMQVFELLKVHLAWHS